MTLAISKALGEGARAVICASTGNTAASAAAYAGRAGLKAYVLIPKGAVALGKLSQSVMHGARVLEVIGNFDICLKVVRDVVERDPVRIRLVNSINPDRIAGQKTAAFEICDQLGDAPTHHFLPVGNAGNITAYWAGYQEYKAAGLSERVPKMMGYQAAESAPIVVGHPIDDPHTVATAIEIGNPASWKGATDARDQSGGIIDIVTDSEILAAYRLIASGGVFAEPASAASVAGLLKYAGAGMLKPGAVVVCTLTGHGLKDPDTALKNLSNTIVVEAGPRQSVESSGARIIGATRPRPIDAMKYVIIHGRTGLADWPCKELGGKTPLEAAHKPNMDLMATRGTLGMVATIPKGMPPGSDVGTMTMLGYDPARYHTGRAPIEAASQGIEMGPRDVVFRMNLVSLKPGDGGALIMHDFTSGHISSEEGAAIVADLRRVLAGDGIEFFNGVSYRHLMVWRHGVAATQLTPPHDITGKEVAPHLPQGEGAERIARSDGSRRGDSSRPSGEPRASRGLVRPKRRRCGSGARARAPWCLP